MAVFFGRGRHNSLVLKTLRFYGDITISRPFSSRKLLISVYANVNARPNVRDNENPLNRGKTVQTLSCHN